MSAASGAILGDGDGSCRKSLPSEEHDFVVEHKATTGKSFRITLDAIHKLELEAYRANKKPALMIDIDGEVFVLFRRCDLDWDN